MSPALGQGDDAQVEREQPQGGEQSKEEWALE